MKITSEIQGLIALPSAVLEGARAHAGGIFASAEEVEFNGDEVDVVELPEWLPPVGNWLPKEELRALGWMEAASKEPSARPKLVSTYGVGRHTDSLIAAGFVMVLFNDGLVFSQGKQRHATLPGQWFLFDDRLPHEVRSTKSSTAYVCVVVPLEKAT